MILQKRGRYEKKIKNKNIMAPSTLLQAFNIFGKLREMGRGERKGENGFFIILLTCRVKTGWRTPARDPI